MPETPKAAVLEMKKTLDKTGVANQFEALCVSAKQSFCNSSLFRLRDLVAWAKAQELERETEGLLGEIGDY